MSDQVPIILDTDIGSDIDDALALAYLLSHPRCDLLGVTTVTGDVVRRAAIVDAMFRAYGRPNIAVYAGCERPVAHGPGQPNVPQFEGIADRQPSLDFRPNEAVDWLRQTIRSHRGEVTLLSIGPFTNLATLFLLDPETAGLCKRIVSMAGRFSATDYNEWNCVVDPAASASVLKRTSNHLLVGLDVTLRCQMPARDVRDRFQSGPKSVVLPMAGRWFSHSELATFHDPLAAALIFQPELATYERGTVVGGIDGETVFSPDPEGPHTICVDVDPEGFFDEYFRITA